MEILPFLVILNVAKVVVVVALVVVCRGTAIELFPLTPLNVAHMTTDKAEP